MGASIEADSIVQDGPISSLQEAKQSSKHNSPSTNGIKTDHQRRCGTRGSKSVLSPGLLAKGSSAVAGGLCEH